MSDVNQLTCTHGASYDKDYKLDGVTLGAPFPLELVEKAMEFPFSTNDVIVASYPRSGEAFLCEIVWLLMNEADIDGATNIPLTRRLPLLEMAGMVPEELPTVERLIGVVPPRVVNTHLPWSLIGGTIKKGKPKVVVILRDPKELLLSLYCSYRRWPGREVPSFTYFFETFVKPDRLLFGKHIEHILGYWNNVKTMNVLVLKYNEMRSNVEESVLKISYFLEKDMTPKQIHSIVKFMKGHQAARETKTNKIETPLIHTLLGVRLFEGEKFNIEGMDPNELLEEEEKKDEEKKDKKINKEKDRVKDKDKDKEKDVEEQRVVVVDSNMVDNLSQTESEPPPYPPMEVEIMTVRKPLKLTPEQEKYMSELCRVDLEPVGLFFPDNNLNS